MDTRDELDLEELAAALRLGVSLLVRRLRQAHADDELSLPHRAALAQLDRGGPMTASDLARLDQISPQSMGATLAALEERALIERRPDPADGRRIVVSLSAAGAAALRERRSARNAQLAAALSAQFSATELAQLAAAAPLLERLGQSL